MRSITHFRTPRMWTSLDLLNQFNELFEDVNRASLNDRALTRDFDPAIDIEEKEGVYLVSVDLPGVKRDDIQINVTDRNLTISGEKKKETRGEGRHYERTYGRFVRSFTLPETINSDAIEAHYEEGVLKLLLPKTEVAEKSKTIKIQAGKPQGLLEKFFGSKEEKIDKH